MRRWLLWSLAPPTTFKYASLLAEQRGYPADLTSGADAFAGDGPRDPVVQTHRDRKLLVRMDPTARPNHSANKEAIAMLCKRLNVRHNHQQRLPRHAQEADNTPTSLPDGACDATRVV